LRNPGDEAICNRCRSDITCAHSSFDFVRFPRSLMMFRQRHPDSRRARRLLGHAARKRKKRQKRNMLRRVPVVRSEVPFS